MTHPLPEQLSEYLDRTLGSDEQRRIDAHLGSCAACATLLDNLRRVLARAQALEDRPPRHDLWPGVAAAIGATPPRSRRIQVSIPMLLAASVALMVLTGGTVGMLLQRRTAPRVTLDSMAPAAGTALVAATADRGYDGAIRALETQVIAGGGRLDSTTVRVVRQKLSLIDRAIADAERALAADPANSYLNGHLTQTRLHKLELLRRAAALSRAVT